MPCYDAREDRNSPYYEGDDAHNSPVAQMLCAVLRRIEAEGTLARLTDHATQEWWRIHKLRDARKGTP